jgi:hypothetical protein
MIVEELTAAQTGAQIVLSFPFTRTPRTRLQRVDIYRLIEPLTAAPGLTEESFSAGATIIASITSDQIPMNQSAVTHIDPLDLKNGTRDVRYRYAVRLVNTSGQAADFSNYAMIAPLFDLALPPIGLRAGQRETEIEISWDAPAANANGEAPANVAGYNIYRSEGSSSARINSEPLTERRFVDRSFQFEANYQYTVRALSLPQGTSDLRAAIESGPSPPLDYTPKDTFPPVPPRPITIASINAMVSLFWPLNPEPDVAGYNIYRSEDESAPPDQWVRLNQQLHKTASFRDDRVTVGRKYSYRITAVDQYGNESTRSEAVSETVAP